MSDYTLDEALYVAKVAAKHNRTDMPWRCDGAAVAVLLDYIDRLYDEIPQARLREIQAEMRRLT